MPATSQVKFHITEAGPKRCVAKIACPVGNSEEHYDNYLQAARAWESQLQEEYETFDEFEKELTFDDLLTPQEEDIELAHSAIGSMMYRNDFSEISDLQNFRSDLTFARNIDQFVTMEPQDRARLDEYLGYLDTDRDGARSTEINQIISRITSKYLVPAAYQAYKGWLREQLEDDPDAQQMITLVAEPYARRRVFGRALRERVRIPQDISFEFERIWNSDVFTPGSKLHTERELREVTEKWRKLDSSDTKEITAEQLGFTNSRSAERYFNSRRRELREFYRNRGRTNPLNIEIMNQSIGFFEG